MKIVAAIFADFVETMLGTPSQLMTPAGGRAILGHTLARAARIEGVSQRCLLVRSRDEGAARNALRQFEFAGRFDLLPLDDGARPRRSLIRSARKWGLDAWRGSPLGTTWFDEYVEPVQAARVLDHYQCDAVLCLDGHQPALDVAIAGAMVQHQTDHAHEAEFVFTQAPPGLAGVVLCRSLLANLLETGSPLGLMLSYRPETPRVDPITKPCCLQIDAAIAQTAARLTGDTRRSRELLAAAFEELGRDCDAASLCNWLGASGLSGAGSLPVEVELELTTDDPLPDTTLRPRGARVRRRHLADIDAVAHLAAQLAEYDDRLLVLGGHGDPLLHPQFADVCRIVRETGACGIAVVTPLVTLSDEALAAFLDAQIDLLHVQIDADAAETYRGVQGADAFEQVLTNIQRIQTLRQQRQSPQPIVAPGITRCSATLSEIEAFFDRWIRDTGWAVISGYNEYAGRLPPDSLLGLTPPVRGPCRRLERRLMLLADGRAVLCSQDVEGRNLLGSWVHQPLRDVWAGAALAAARQAHGCLNLSAYPLCQACREWFRP